MLTSYDRQTGSSYCCIQLVPSPEGGTVHALLCLVLITTCNILNLVFELTIRLLYDFHMRTCAVSQ